MVRSQAVAKEKTIAGLAEAAGVGVETVRYYQRRGLMPVPKATNSSFRTYDDTHVERLTRRLGLTEEKQPEKIERDLIELVPRRDWIDFSHLLIYHGRRVCKARTPLCEECIVEKLCPSSLLR